MDWISDLVPPPDTRGPVTLQSFSTDVLPSLLLLYLTAYLVQTPGTLPVRLTLLPVTLWSFFRTATRIDLVYGLKNHEELVYLNQGFVLVMTVGAARCIAWSYQQTPFCRLYPIPGAVKAEGAALADKSNRLWDSLDLCFNLRGHGWDWSRGLQVPPQTRPTYSCSAFLLSTFLSFVTYLLVGDHLHWCVQWFDPATIGSARGGSIYSTTLPPLQNFLRSTLISFLGGLTVCASIQAAYDLSTLIGVGIFRQHPLQWPPIFDAPWLATSLTEFWAKRWHQLFRDIFISVGGKPLSMLVGRPGAVMGAFFISGILHDFGLWGMGRGGEFSTVGGYFLIQGLGIILEHTWRHFTGTRVGGFWGRCWTWCWTIMWGCLIVDAWSRKGLCGSVFHQDQFRPSFRTLGPLPLVSS